jgi:hypothetical protein
VVLQEETDSSTNFWLLGDNFLQGYYQVHDIGNKLIGLASSTYITSNSFTYNNTVMYVSTPGSDASNPEDNNPFKLSGENLMILIIAVCAGGAVILAGGLICCCCYIRMRKKKRMEQAAK